MDVIFFIVGHVKIDYQLDVVNVYTAGHNVCGNKNVHLSGPKGIHGFVALALRKVAVHGTNIEACP